MKKLTRLLSLALAILMVMSLAGAAFADPVAPLADRKATIKVTNCMEGTTYNFYKLMSVTQGEGEDSNKYSYTVNPTYLAALKTATGATDEAGIIANITAKNASAMREFAKALFEQIKAMTPDETATAVTDSGTKETAASVECDCGYYLIAPSDAATADGYVPIMVYTNGNAGLSIAAKVDAPRSSKKLKETNDTRTSTSPWQDGADWDIGDYIPFRLRCTVTENISAYTSYEIVFHDEPSAGLTFVNDADHPLTVQVIHGVDHGNNTETVDPSCYQILRKSENNLGDNCGFHVVFSNIQAMKTTDNKDITMHGGEFITIEFKMQLNSNAQTGPTGNPNESWISYSNNPFDSNSKGTTPHDKVKVFTYLLTVNKVDDANQPLEGASFQLYKVVLKDTTKDSGSDAYDLVAWGPKNEGADNGSGVKSKFEWKGLDAGTYKLEEVDVPDGYTKAKDVYFTIAAKYQAESDDPLFSNETDAFTVTVRDESLQADTSSNAASFTVDATAGSLSTTIKNVSGTVLPSTGGIGTTLFYVFGSVLVIGAGVLLVSKKRMGAVD